MTQPESSVGTAYGRGSATGSTLHVLLLPSWYPTAEEPIAGVFFREQAHALERAGHRVGVVAVRLQSLRSGALRTPRASIIDDEGVWTYRQNQLKWLPRIPYGNALLWLRAGERLYRRYVAAHGVPDVLHAHGALYGGLLAAQLRRRYEVPAILTEHSTEYARGSLRKWQSRLAERAFRGVDARIAVSPGLGTLLHSMYPNAYRSWVAIPNVLDQRFVHARCSTPRYSDPNRFRFLNVAMLTEKKGHADLLRAYARAFGRDDSVELRIAGDGPLRSPLQTLAEELGVGNRVVFCGMLTRDQIVEEMLGASAFVLASHYETFGVVVAEALACGLPVVATRCGGPEFIVREEDGLLVPARDPAALAAALRQTRATTARRDSEEIRSACIARFGETTVVRAIVAEYMRVLQSGSAAPAPGRAAGDVRRGDE